MSESTNEEGEVVGHIREPRHMFAEKVSHRNASEAWTIPINRDCLELLNDERAQCLDALHKP